MEKIKLFPDSKIGYDEYLKSVQEIVGSTKVVSCSANLSVGIDSIVKIDDPVKRQKMIDASLLLDEESVSPRTRNNKIFKKLPVIMTVANMLANHYDRVEDLSVEQLVLLGHFSYYINSDFMSEHLRIAANSELMQTVMDKTADRNERLDILGVVEDKYFEFAIDKEDDISLNKFTNESILVIKQTPKEELLGMVKPIEVAFEELEKAGVRF